MKKSKSIPDRRAALEGESYRSHGRDDIFVVEPKSEGSTGCCKACTADQRRARRLRP